MRRFGLIYLILIAALVIRVGWVCSLPATDAALDRLPDQREYLSLARNLMHNHALCFFDRRFDQTVYAYRMPGYPLFLAICGGSVRVARLLQCGVDVGTVLAVFLIASRLSDNKWTGLFAAGLMAINPFYVFFCGLLLSETVFAALLIWAIFMLLCGRWKAATFLLVCSCYIRPTGILLVPVLMIAANRPGLSAYRLWDATRSGVLAAIITFLCLFPWAWRNHHLLGAWIFTTTNSGVTLYDGFHPGATGASDQRFVMTQPGLMSINEVERSRYFTEQARQWIAANWRQIPALSMQKLLRGWTPVPLSAEFGRLGYRVISAGYSVPFDLLALIGLCSRRLDRRAKWLLLCPALVLTLAQVLSVGSIRYRMPAEAAVAVLSAEGVSVLVSKMRPKQD